MPIVIRLDRELVARKMTLTELSERVGITVANLSILKTGKAKAIRLATLEDAGFARDAAANTLTAVVHYAIGYSIMQLSYRSAVPVAVGGVAIDGESELDTIVRLTRALPPDAPSEFVRVARDCCAADFDKQFEFGLDALLAGLDPQCDTRTPSRP